MKSGFAVIFTLCIAALAQAKCPMKVWCSTKSDCALPGQYPTYDCGKYCYNSGYDSDKKLWNIIDEYAGCMSDCCHRKIGANTFCFKSSSC
ncbi:hypothetical protein K7432_013142 [Basidiobolus ranarum]|uniref:Uncharacterized protein n=1 Tax=Basidiobolus ranarum TaxID=34480 RepID=A0ABR2VQU4_9FUNG